MKIRMINCFLLLFIVLLMSCLKDTIVDCHYRCIYVFSNQSGETTQVTLSVKEDFKRNEIEISKPVFQIAIDSQVVDTIDLLFDHEGSCRLGVNANKDFYGITFQAIVGDSTIAKNLVPFDTTLGYFEFCSDCIHEYSDTLTIE